MKTDDESVDEHAFEDCEIDPGAEVARATEPIKGAWVAAWVWVADDEE